VSDETSGGGLDVTLRDFAGGQKLFGRYTLTKILGRGGMGVVWLAHDDELDRDVALKFLPELIIHDRAVLSDLKRETKRSLELTHKNIVRIHDFVHNEQSGCISMEFIDGDTLSNLRSDKENKVFKTEELREWVGQLCDALDYAHNHARIIHRDLKPANLMVNQRGHLKVADFGIARSLSDSMSLLTMSRGTSGTLVFMSPQQLDGERGTHLDDIYSFGATIYELLTSKPPFYSGDIHRQIREKTPPLMSQRRKDLEITSAQIPLEWEKTIAACLEKNPAKRPQSIRDTAVRLNVAAPSSHQIPYTPIAKSSRRNSFIIATAAAIAVAAFATWWFGVQLPREKTHSLPQKRMLSGGNITGTGKVMVKTAPAGAKVIVGEMAEVKTPATFSSLPQGKYPLRIRLDGYQPVEREIEVKQNELTDLGVIALQPESGSVELTSDPVGATVQQGDRILGVTPLSLEHFPVGTSKFTISASTYSPKNVEISVAANRTTAVSVSLARLPTTTPTSVPTTNPAKMPIAAATSAPSPTSTSRTGRFAGTWTGIVPFKDPFVGGGGDQQSDLVINAEENSLTIRVSKPGGGSFHTATTPLVVMGDRATGKGGFLKHMNVTLTLTGDGSTATIVVHDSVWGTTSGTVRKIK
jgi:Protein kinase domain/PEGA domain